jgi:hypothetical protein
MLVYSTQDEGIRRLACVRLHGIDKMASKESWVLPFKNWLRHLKELDIPYVPYLLFVRAQMATYLRTYSHATLKHT